MKLRLLLALIFLHASALATGAASTQAATSPLPDGLGRMVLSLIIVIGVLIGISVLFKKWGGPRVYNTLPIKTISAMHISQTQKIMVVEVGEEWLVLGVTPQHITALSHLPKKENITAIDAPTQPTFAMWLKEKLNPNHPPKP